MLKVGFIVLSGLLVSSMGFAYSCDESEAKAALAQTMMESRMAAAEKEISQPLFAEPSVSTKKKVESPLIMQLSENEVEIEIDEDDFVLDEE